MGTANLTDQSVTKAKATFLVSKRQCPLGLMDGDFSSFRFRGLAWSLLVLAVVSPVAAQSRESANYRVVAQSIDGGGERAVSPDYQIDASLGGVSGFAGGIEPTPVIKTGYLGQINERIALELGPVPAVVEENSVLLLSGALLLDDESLTELRPADLSWKVVSGPLEAIQGDASVTAASVYQDTVARVQGEYAGLSTPLDLTVLDGAPDNFGSYAFDGLPDGWQVQYFGFDNSLAAPLRDPDGDGQNNLFEFTAGLIPTDPRSRFTFRLALDPSQAGALDLQFHPVLADRTYTILTTTHPGKVAWKPLVGLPFRDIGDLRIVTDFTESEPQKFYQIRIEKP